MLDKKKAKSLKKAKKFYGVFFLTENQLAHKNKSGKF